MSFPLSRARVAVVQTLAVAKKCNIHSADLRLLLKKHSRKYRAVFETCFSDQIQHILRQPDVDAIRALVDLAGVLSKACEKVQTT